MSSLSLEDIEEYMLVLLIKSELAIPIHFAKRNIHELNTSAIYHPGPRWYDLGFVPDLPRLPPVRPLP